MMIDFSDLTVPAEQLLEHTDPDRKELFEYRAALQASRAALSVRDDGPALWASNEIESELARVALALDASERAAPKLEQARAAFAAAVQACRDAAEKIAIASTVDTLLRARAESELAERAALRSRLAFGEAASAARVPAPGAFPLFAGWRARQNARATEALARHERTLRTYRYGYGCFAVDVAITQGRSLTPEHMVWEIAAEDDGNPSYRIRFWQFAQRHGIAHERVDLHELDAREA